LQGEWNNALLITTKERGEERQWQRMKITRTAQGNSSGGKQQKNARFQQPYYCDIRQHFLR